MRTRRRCGRGSAPPVRGTAPRCAMTRTGRGRGSARRRRERPRGRLQERARRQPVPGPRGPALHREAHRAARPPPGSPAWRRPAGVRLPRRPGLPLAGRRRLPLALRGRRKKPDDRPRRRLRAARTAPACRSAGEGADEFFTVVAGTAARAGAPVSYLEVRAAHPRKSGKVRFNLATSWRWPDPRDPRRDRCDRDRRLPAGRASAVADGGPVRARVGLGSGRWRKQRRHGGGVSLPGGGSGDSPAGSNDPACSGLAC